VVEGTLATLPERAARENVKPPALVIVGEVVRLRERLGWFSRSQTAAELSTGV
jgi:uroporphyrin-III C-methyltransferase/precorrin-2 dehydrogenase/sirohydrochlorin ferrochelatase